MDSPTSSVLSPIEKRRLHVEESSEVVIAVTERKVCCPEEIVANGFKLSGYYTDQPCLVPKLVSSDTHANAICTEKWVMFFGVNAFLSSRVVVIVQHTACTSQPLTEFNIIGRLKRQKQIISLSLILDQIPSESQLHTAGKIHQHWLRR